jgi:hypothetical protein
MIEYYSTATLEAELERRKQFISEKEFETKCEARGHSFIGNEVVFKWEDPDFYVEICTMLYYKAFGVWGTRIISGNGAIDGTLKPCYKAVLPKINEIRQSKGLDKINY